MAAILLPYASIKSQKDRSGAEQEKSREVGRQRIVDRLISPAGQLALLNPDRINKPPTPLRPVVLPFAEIQADLPNVVLDQVRALGCPIHFRQTTGLSADQGAICVGVRKSDVNDVRGRLFITGTFVSTRLVPHVFLESAVVDVGRPVARRFQDAHRINIDLSDGRGTYRWILPVQVRVDPKTRRVKDGLGLTAYKLDDQGVPITRRPDFTGAWLVEGECSQPDEPAETCLRSNVFSIAVPRDKWGQPAEAGRVAPQALTARLVVNAPAVDAKLQVLLDSSAAESAVLPFVTSDLQGHLLPGESITVGPVNPVVGTDRVAFSLNRAAGGESARLQSFGERVLNWIPTNHLNADDPLSQKRTFVAQGRHFELNYKSTPQGLDPEFVQSSARLAAYALFMIAAIMGTWIAIEFGVVRRVLKLTSRTRQLSRAVRAEGDLDRFDFSDLRGRDELGVLASGFDDLLHRISEDVQREANRLRHESSMLRAIGHELRSPLQSLSALLGESEQGRSYVRRMLRAVDALYGRSSPSEGIESAAIDVEQLNLGAFLAAVAKNSHHAGVDDVVFEGPPEGVVIRADPSALEDTLSHILTNANRYRPQGTVITIQLVVQDGVAEIEVHNHGPHIPSNLIDRIFDYGVSDRPDSIEGNRGQGLFVAATYVSKMGGHISAKNLPEGVAFVISLPVVKG